MQKASVRSHCLLLPAANATFSTELRRHVCARADIQYSAIAWLFGRREPCSGVVGLCFEPLEKQSLPKRCDGAPRIEWLTEVHGETGLIWDWRRSVWEGVSPNSFRYSTEKRPNSRKPNPVAICVTVTRLQSAANRTRLASDNRNKRRRRQGGRP
jgi:hypothetical protein